MIFLDSWIWLEYVFDGATVAGAADTSQGANTGAGGMIGPTVIADSSYRVRRVENDATAEETVRAIHDFDGIESMPLVDEIAEHVAELRAEYYDPGERELSYADAIHLATAVVHDDCDVLYSGDQDFEGIDAIETVVL